MLERKHQILNTAKEGLRESMNLKNVKVYVSAEVVYVKKSQE